MIIVVRRLAHYPDVMSSNYNRQVALISAKSDSVLAEFVLCSTQIGLNTGDGAFRTRSSNMLQMSSKKGRKSSYGMANECVI